MSLHPVAFIGGFHSVKEIRASIPPSCRLVGLCDIRKDLIEACRKEAPDLLCTTDFREIAAMSDCRTVATFTPNATHRDIALACLEGGKNVFIEKPMGINLEEGHEILKAEAKSGRFVGVDLECRFSRMTGREIRNILDSGELGQILKVECDHHRGGWLCDSPSGVYRTKKATSGLMKMDGIHQIDLFRHWNGEIMAVQSFAAPNALKHYEFHDNITCIIWFKNGAMGRFTSSHSQAAYSLGNDLKRAPSFGHMLRWAIVGTKGALDMDGWAQNITLYHFSAHPAGTDSIKPEFDRKIDLSELSSSEACHDMEGYRNHFLESMACGRPPFQRASDAYRSEQIAWACDQSVYEDGRKMDCSHFELISQKPTIAL